MPIHRFAHQVPITLVLIEIMRSPIEICSGFAFVSSKVTARQSTAPLLTTVWRATVDLPVAGTEEAEAE